ncbi:MAG: polysaccharide pyruvyl transferase family protein [Spirochaetales bacterium]|nr:polysaccharide pyruvyl transferase family protein [Spirochaetales bacterium]
MLSFTPFFINSNLITNKSSLIDYDTFFNAVAGNTGNSYITWALLKELGIGKLEDDFHIQNIYDFDFSYTDKVAEFVNSNCSHVFLILQDQIRINESYGYKLPYNGIKNLLEKINKPVIVAGLGANCFTGFDSNFHKQLPEDLIEFLHYLSHRCNELGVRGNFTAEVLNQLGIKNVTPIGCPSFFETGPNRIIKKKNFITEDRVFFTSNYPSPLNRTAFQVCQDHQEKEIVKAIAFDSIENFASNEVFIDKYIKKRYRIFSDIGEWKNFASQFDFSLGYRVHGCILSLNSGIVSVCCNGDSRAKEMCELLKIPHFPALNPESDLVKLYNEIDISVLNNAYPSLYETFSSFIKRNCNIEISSIHITGGG